MSYRERNLPNGSSVSMADFMNSRLCNGCELQTSWADWERDPTHCEHCGDPFDPEETDGDPTDEEAT